MDSAEIIPALKKTFPDFKPLSVSSDHPDEVLIRIEPRFFKDTCMALHKMFSSPVMAFFAVDEREGTGQFAVNAVFADFSGGRWITVNIGIPQENPSFDSLARVMHSAILFERRIKEMFGIEPEGNPDPRRLDLHDEVWPQGNYPLRKDFCKTQGGDLGGYKFSRVEGEGIFEIPVGPVHAGVIGPGHFRFSCAGEPVISLETRLGFTHRGVEKLFEGSAYERAARISERVSGDSVFAHSLAFTQAAEKISGITVPAQELYARAIFLELERMYNHVNDIGGIAVDVGFSFPAAYASLIKEAILQLNQRLCGDRYLKGVNILGGVSACLSEDKKKLILDSIAGIKKDFSVLAGILVSSVSFMDRVDDTGVLKRKTAEDLGIVGLAARASGIPMDLRKHFPGAYREAKFKMITQQAGDVLARLKIRMLEFEESCRLIEAFTRRMGRYEKTTAVSQLKQGSGLGYAEGWRGPILYWLKISADGLVQRCSITDPSFHNWPGLCYAVLGNIIPDFPLCNKSFDLSYSGNDL